MAGVFMTGTGASTGAGMMLMGAGGALFRSSCEGVVGMAALKSAAKTSKGLSDMIYVCFCPSFRRQCNVNGTSRSSCQKALEREGISQYTCYNRKSLMSDGNDRTITEDT